MDRSRSAFLIRAGKRAQSGTPHAKENHADCSRNALCSWRKTFEGDGRRHGGHCR